MFLQNRFKRYGEKFCKHTNSVATVMAVFRYKQQTEISEKDIFFKYNNT